VAAVILAAFLVTDFAMAQGGQGGGQGMARRRGQGMGAQRGPRGPGRGFMQRLRDLPPEEQERVLKNDRRFQRLSAEQQARIRENLQRWNALTPPERERLRERQRVFQGLSPNQRQEARAIFQQWRDLPPPRRRELRLAFRHLRNLSPGQREHFLSSPRIQSRFSPDEIRILRDLSRLLPEGAVSPEPPPEP
jgi:Protein of unknown function (DUF3106)